MATTTPNMGLIKPGVGTEAGPLWATYLNSDQDTLDAHDHSSGKGVPVTPAGMDITSALSFGSNDATALRSTRFTSQSALFSLAADVNAAYVYGGELYFRDASGNNVKITNGGVLNAAALAANNWTQSDKSADYTILPADTFAHLRMDATAGNRVVTLPSAASVSEGRYYFISDSAGQCSATRTITVQRAGTDTMGAAAGPFSVTIESKFGAVLVVRVGTGTWYVFRQNQLATTTAHGALMLAGDLGGTAHSPTVTAITGPSPTGVAEMRMRTLRFEDTVTSPFIGQEGTGSATGQTLRIVAQDAATTGGDLSLEAGLGSGPGDGGDVHLKISGNAVLSAIDSAPQAYARVAGGGSLLFEKSVTPLISQEARTTAGAGTALAFAAQAAHTAGAGGTLSIAAGAAAGNAAGGPLTFTSGAGAGTGASGDISLAVGAAGATGAGGSITQTAGTGATNGSGGDVFSISGAGAGTGLDGRVTLQVGGTQNVVQGAEVAAGRYVLGLLGSATAAAVPAGNLVAFLANVGTAPSTNPASDVPSGGAVFYADAGLFTIKNGGASGLTMKFGPSVGTGIASLTTSGATTSSAGTSYTAYLQVTINGTAYRIGLYT